MFNQRIILLVILIKKYLAQKLSKFAAGKILIKKRKKETTFSRKKQVLKSDIYFLADQVRFAICILEKRNIPSTLQTPLT